MTRPAIQAVRPPKRKPKVSAKPASTAKPLGWGAGRAKHGLKHLAKLHIEQTEQ